MASVFWDSDMNEEQQKLFSFNQNPKKGGL
jgi:hypothetical protein